MAIRIVNSNPQTYVPDCYAPAPAIDLTLRCNGEEAVQLMDALGNFVEAGIDAPTAAPSAATTGTVGTFTASQFWNYIYVYVLKARYPLVQNAVTGGGSQAPRSNPSPSVQANSSVNTNAWQVTIPTSTRADVDFIWIYRTQQFADTVQAATNATAGALFWVKEIPNNQNIASVSWLDTGPIAAAGLEEVETDNFVAPQFNKAIYIDPYFWGIGNDQRDYAVSVLANGQITLTNPIDKWFSGRNGQIVSFDGISTGGYDNKGNYYFKFVTNVNGQVYADIALSIIASLNLIGTTTAHIRGPGATLYRSKPRNPFSWGETLTEGSVNIPQVYNFQVGGGTATAIDVIPTYSLLKIDTEKPTACYTLSLKNAGTPNFEASKRTISDDFSVSVQKTAYAAPSQMGYQVTWGLDTKNFAIVISDGVTQVDVSSKVNLTLRQMSLNGGDRVFYHSVFSPRMQLLCFFIRTNGAAFTINKMIYFHWPSNQWGTMNVFDILCSTNFLHPVSKQQIVLVGTQSGFIGEFFAYDTNDLPVQACWYKKNGVCLVDSTTNEILTTTVFNIPADIGVIGNWMTVVFEYTGQSASVPWDVYYCRIATVATAGPNYRVTFDLVLDRNLLVTTFPGVNFVTPPLLVTWWIGLIESKIGKFFNAGLPFDYKKVEEVLATYVLGSANRLTCQFGTAYFYVGYEQYMIKGNNSTIPGDQNSNWIIQGNQNFPFDFADVFGIMLIDRSYPITTLMNIQITLNRDGSSTTSTR